MKKPLEKKRPRHMAPEITKDVSPAIFSKELVGALVSLKQTMDAINLKDTSMPSDGSKQFGQLPGHLQTLLF